MPGPTVQSRWSYACSKAIDKFPALAFHKQYGLPAVIAPLYNKVGPRQTGRYGMVLPHDQAYDAGFEDMRHHLPDISKAGRTIGYRPKISPKEIIRRLVEHARKEEPSRHA